MRAAAMTVGITLRRLAISFISSQEIFKRATSGASQVFLGVGPLGLPDYQNASSGDTVDGERFLPTGFRKHRAGKFEKA
jgi:hypothetical protein